MNTETELEIGKLLMAEVSEWINKTDDESPYTMAVHNDGEMGLAVLSWKNCGGERSSVLFMLDAGDMQPRQIYLDQQQTAFLAKAFL